MGLGIRVFRVLSLRVERTQNESNYIGTTLRPKYIYLATWTLRAEQLLQPRIAGGHPQYSYRLPELPRLGPRLLLLSSESEVLGFRV